MTKAQGAKYEMFGRVRKFGIASRDVFPEASAVGKKFGHLAEEVSVVEEQLVRQGQARVEARKVKLDTRHAARDYMKALASAGRRVSTSDVGPHPFRLPQGKSATVVLTAARLLKEEADRREDKFAELGLPPTFMTDFAKAVDDLAQAIGTQQDSRAARRKAQGALDAALDRGMAIIADLDVAVTATLRADRARLAEWSGARRIDHVGDAKAEVPPAGPGAPAAPTPDDAATAPSNGEVPKVAA